LVETPHYEPERRGFNFRLCYWDFLIDLILLAALCSRGQLSF